MTSGSPRSGSRGPSIRPDGLPERVVAEIETHLRQRELRRDDLFERARRLRRLAQGTMTRLQQGELVAEEVAEIRRSMAEFAGWIRSEARGDEGPALDALQEGVEALLLEAVVRDRELPGPSELGVDPEPYLLGLGDLVGEVRRLALQRLSEGSMESAERSLALMEHLFQTLMRFDTPRAIVALKPKQDAARLLLERTRGEVAFARLLDRARLHLTEPPDPRR